jgi:hypothetical protein
MAISDFNRTEIVFYIVVTVVFPSLLQHVHQEHSLPIVHSHSSPTQRPSIREYPTYIMDNVDDEPESTTSPNFPFTPPPQRGQPPRYQIPSTVPQLQPNTRFDTLTHHANDAQFDPATAIFPHTPPVQHTTPPTNLPRMNFGPRFATMDNGRILVFDDDNMAEASIEAKVRAANQHPGDAKYEETVQKAVLDLISIGRLTTQVFVKLRGNYLFNFLWLSQYREISSDCVLQNQVAGHSREFHKPSSISCR